MTADKFLRQIEIADRTIDSKLSELYRLKCLVTSITVPTDRETIQTSGVSDKVGNIVAKIVDLENEIDTIIDEYIEIRQKCISVVEQLSDKPVEYAVIHKHYVLYKSFTEIGQEEGYSYDGIMKVRKRALKRIDAILSKKNTEK